jgi:hypothetical protein
LLKQRLPLQHKIHIERDVRVTRRPEQANILHGSGDITLPSLLADC